MDVGKKMIRVIVDRITHEFIYGKDLHLINHTQSC